MERTVNPLASARCRYFSGVIFDNAGPGAVCARAGDKTPGETPSTTPVKTARTNKRDKTVVFMLSLLLDHYSRLLGFTDRNDGEFEAGRRAKNSFILRGACQRGLPAELLVRHPGVFPPLSMKLPSQRWRDLILRVWHVDALRRPVCQKPHARHHRH